MADSIITFKEFCDLCEKIQTSNKVPDKEKLLTNFIKKYKELDTKSASESTFYPALRLLVPEYERERSAYGLKVTTFSKLIVRVLCLQGNDRNNLLKFNQPSNNLKTTNDFADIAYWVLRKFCPTTSSLTIADVNNHLDCMVQKHAEHQPREVDKELSRMIKCSTAVEQKWIIRIILKSMKLGMGNDRILKVFHPDAPDLYDISSSLSKVCRTLKDPATRLHELEIELFTPFRPMLSLQCDANVLEQVFQEEKSYYVENKYDGERFQLHMKDGVFKYFSKNGYDYSENYGENYNSFGLITPHLSEIFSKYDSLILDGEMMGWNKKTKSFGSKGMSYDVKKMTKDSKHRPCFCVFDILFLNGAILTNKPLSERLEILDNLFGPIHGVIVQSPRLEVKTKQEIMDELNKTVDRQEEGICFKDPISIYKPNNRKSGWWKMKLEYFDGLLEELDVLIIGGYYAEGRRKGKINSFLLGVAATADKDGDIPNEFHTFAKVASGITDGQLDKLLTKLNPYWEPFETNKNPEGILWKKEKPDCWIDPRKSCVLQVKASELARTSEFQTDYTLRFPRVKQVRDDKPWYNCLTLAELKEYTKSNKAVEKLSSRHLTGDDIDVSPSKRSRKSKDLIDSLYHLANIEQKTDFLANKEFCVFTGNETCTKESLEVKIKECGGRIVQYPGPKTYCTLVGDVTPRVKTLIDASSSDIVKLEWMIKIIDNATMINLTPKDMITTSSKTKLMFSNRFDKFGDPYSERSSKNDIEDLLQNILTIDTLLPSEIINFDKELSFENPLGIFRSCFVYFDKNESNLQLLEYKLIFYGGTKCESIEDHTTHVVIHSSDQSGILQIKRRIEELGKEDVKIVNKFWIEECLKQNELISEELFLLN